MFSLAAPLFLFTLIGLALPLAIHLINRGAGPRIKVGSIRYLEEAEHLRFRGLKLEEPWLLSLRLLLLAILAILLAGPFWHGGRQTEKPGWVLASRKFVENPQHYPDAQKALEGLVERGFEIRYLLPGLPKPGTNPAELDSEKENNLWSILMEADAELDPGQELVVFSESRLEDFAGTRPKLGREITWRTLSDEATNRWVERAVRNNDDTLRVTLGTSNAEGNRFEEVLVPLPAQAGESAREGPVTASLSANRDVTVSLRTEDPFPQDNSNTLSSASWEIPVFFDAANRAEDAGYLDAALWAIAQRTGLPINIRKLEAAVADFPDERTSLAFWLSEIAVPDELLDWVARGTLLFTDSAAAPFDATDTSFALEAASMPVSIEVSLRAPALETGTVLWRDGFGEPLLVRESRGEGALIHFYSRFHPQWCGLVLEPAFPEWVLSLTAETHLKGTGPAADMRVLSESQAVPGIRERETDTGKDSRHGTPLHTALWLLGLAGFLVERWWSEARTV